jgi:phosphoribosyl 1,2-cyclic phosphate phosphodiesterase
MSSSAPPVLERVEITLLGTGTSTGVPIIGCSCAVCTSDDPRDTRLRTSAHVVAHTAAGPVHLQIDAGPDFRRQALAHGITAADAVLCTHAHFDHVVGLDDLRPLFFGNRTPIPVCCLPNTAEQLRQMFGYIFEDGTYPGVSKLEIREVAAGEPFVVESRMHAGAAVEVVSIAAFHGRLPVLGFRVGALAFLTDVSHLPDASYSLLENLDVLVLDGLRPEPHPTHLSFDGAVEVARRVGAKTTRTVHLSHNVSHVEAERLLPPDVQPGYDGLVLRASA